MKKILLISLLFVQCLALSAKPVKYTTTDKKAISFSCEVKSNSYLGKGSVKFADPKCIPYGAFRDQQNLESVVIPEGVEVILNGAFAGCKNLKDVKLPSTLRYINDYAFVDCNNLVSIELPEGLISLGKDALARTGFTSITIPSTLETLSQWAFSGSRLESLYIPETVKFMGVEVFGRNGNLKSVVIAEGITSIPDGFFFDCFELQYVNLPQSLREIGANVFRDCHNLKQITFPSNLVRIGKVPLNVAHPYPQQFCLRL